MESLNVAGRMVICNMAVEMGAKTAYMQPNQDVLDYVSNLTIMHLRQILKVRPTTGK